MQNKQMANFFVNAKNENVNLDHKEVNVFFMNDPLDDELKLSSINVFPIKNIKTTFKKSHPDFSNRKKIHKICN